MVNHCKTISWHTGQCSTFTIDVNVNVPFQFIDIFSSFTLCFTLTYNPCYVLYFTSSKIKILLKRVLLLGLYSFLERCWYIWIKSVSHGKGINDGLRLLVHLWLLTEKTYFCLGSLPGGKLGGSRLWNNSTSAASSGGITMKDICSPLDGYCSICQIETFFVKMTPSDINRVGWYEPVKMQYVQLVRLSWSTSLYVYNWWNFPDLDTVSAHGHFVSQSWVNVMGCCLTMPNNHLGAISQEIYKFFLAQTHLKSEMAQAKDESYVYAHVYMWSQTLGHTQTLT